MNEKCWMCGNNADSSEHIFKARDLKRFFDEDGYGFDNLPFHFKDGGSRRIPGPRSARMKYPKFICGKCNNESTAAADHAYDRLSDWFVASQDNEGLLRVDWFDVFGNDWRFGLDGLKRYCAKSLGCRILSSGYSLSPEFPNPVSGANLERLQISICNTQPFRFLPDYDPKLFNSILGKGDLFGSFKKDDELRRMSSALWWENIGHFQLSHWFNIRPNSAYGAILNEKRQHYEIRYNLANLNETKSAMQAWLEQSANCFEQFLQPLISVILSAYAGERLINELSIASIENLASELAEIVRLTSAEIDQEILSYRTQNDLNKTVILVRKATELLAATAGTLLGFIDGRGKSHADIAQYVLNAMHQSNLNDLFAGLQTTLNQTINLAGTEDQIDENLLRLGDIASDAYNKLGFVLRSQDNGCYVEIPFRRNNSPPGAST
jgi:hypothetical protein